MAFDEERASQQADPVLADFFGGTSTPTQKQIDFLIKRLGVPPLALGRDADGGGLGSKPNQPLELTRGS